MASKKKTEKYIEEMVGMHQNAFVFIRKIVDILSEVTSTLKIMTFVIWLLIWKIFLSEPVNSLLLLTSKKSNIFMFIPLFSIPWLFSHIPESADFIGAFWGVTNFVFFDQFG